MASIVEQILLSINASVAGAAQVAQLSGNIGGLTSKILGLNQGMQVIGQVTAGVNQLVSQMGEYARKADGAAVAARSWQIVLERFNVDAGKAEASMQMLADKTGATTESLKGAAAQYIKMGGTLEDFEKGALAAASSWYDLSVKSISLEDSISNVTLGLAQGRSELMETSGIVVNASQAWKKYADANNTTVDAMDDATKAHAYALAVYKEEQIGIETLADKQTALSKAETQATNSKKELGKAIGTLVLPAYTQMITGSTQVTRGITEMLQAYAKGEDGLAKLTQAFPGLSSVMGKIGPEGNRMKEAITGAWDAIRGTYDSVLKPIFERLEPLAKRVWAEVPRLITAAANVIRENFLLIQTLWNNVLKPVWDAIAPIVAAALGQVINLLGGLLNFMAGVNTAIRKLLSGDWAAAWAAARDAVGNALLKIQDALAELAPKVWKAITDIATGVWDKAKMIGRNLRDGIMAPLLDLKEALQVKVLEAVNGMLSAIPQSILDKIGLGNGVPGAGQALNDTRTEQGNIQQREAARAAVEKLDANTQATMFFRAIFGQESGGNYGAINTRTGALGKYQVMPQHLVDNQYDPARNTRAWLEANWNNPGKPGQGWDAKNGGFQVTPKQFLETPEIQEAIAQAQMAANLQKRLTEAGGNLEKAIKEAAKDWYGRGKVAPGEPTPDEYAQSVYQRFLDASGLVSTNGSKVQLVQNPAAKDKPAGNTAPPPADPKSAPSAEDVRKSVEAQIADILARLDLKLIGKDAAIKLLAQIDADATRIARKQGTGWQEYAATAKSAQSAIDGLKKGNTAAKETKDLLGALSTQYEYVGKTGLPEYVKGLNAFIAAQDKAAKSARAGSKEQVEAQANVNRARQMLADTKGPKAQAVVSDADLKKYSAAAREVVKLEEAISKSTDTAWVARAQARIAAYNAQGEAAQGVLSIIQGTSSRQQEIDAEADARAKTVSANRLAADRALADGQITFAQGKAQSVITAYDLEVKAAGSNAEDKLAVERRLGADTLAARQTLAKANAQSETSRLERERNKAVNEQGLTLRQRQDLWNQYAGRIAQINSGLTKTIEGNVADSNETLLSLQVAAGQAVSALVDAQIAGVNAQFRDVQGATDMAYRRTYGADDAGLIKSLAATTGLSVATIRADVQAALEDAKRYAPAAAAAIERVWADALAHRREVGAAERQEAADTAKSEQDSYASTRQFVLDTLKDRNDDGLIMIYSQARATRDTELMAAVVAEILQRAEVLNTRINTSLEEQSTARIAAIRTAYDAEQGEVEDASITVDSLTKTLNQLVAEGRDPSETGFTDWLKELIEKGGKAGDAAKKVSDNLLNLVAAARLVSETPVPLTGMADARGVRTIEGTPVAARGTVTGPEFGGPVEARGALTPEQSRWKESVEVQRRIDEYTASLKKLEDAQLSQALTTAFAAGNQERYNLILAEQKRRTDAAAKGQEDATQQAVKQTADYMNLQQRLADAEREVAAALGETEAPFQGLIDRMEDMKLEAGADIPKLDELIKRLKLLQGQTEGLAKFNKIAGNVSQIAGAFGQLGEAIGGDLGANISGAMNALQKGIAIAQDIASGNWVGAITKVVAGIADAIAGFQKVRAEVAKLKEDFNKQFTLIDATTFSSFTTRSRGFFADVFGGGPEIVKQINESAAAIAKTIETGVLGGFSNGIKAFLNGTGTMLDAIREGVRGAIIDAITQAVIQGAIIKGALGSLLTELTNGLAAGTDVSGVIAQIGAALPGIAKGLETTLKPLKDAVDRALPASTPAGSASTSGSSFGSGSSTFQAGTPAVVIDVLTQTRDLLKGANDASRLMVDAARSLGGHVDRFGDYVDKLNGPHNSATAGAR